ncbi:RDD family protein [Tropicimonas sp.]|uniref:RDD family protein n=1 Tax=Tropicimonas sp. TaxID=2067044 RepID=UPI003A8B1245
MAWVIDIFVIALMVVLAVFLTVFLTIYFLPVLWLMIGFLYRVITITRGSATWGMRVVSIELRNRRGERFSLGDAILHTGLYSLCVSFLIPQLISAAMMLTTARAQGLHDLALGTVAINRGR